MLLIFILVYYINPILSFDANSDSVPFKINWRGPEKAATQQDESADGSFPKETDSLLLTTIDKEVFKCKIPRVLQTVEDEISSYTGPDAAQLLRPLFLQNSCSYRIENYWTYELCHNRHVRQYHEEKISKGSVRVQEYRLGEHAVTYEEVFGPLEPPDAVKQKPLPFTKRVMNVEMPYFAVNFTNGTKCDLLNKPRTIRVLYICNPDSSGEIFELSEVSTCEYEAIVLTGLLCKHPAYRVKENPVNAINCHPMSDTLHKPKRLIKIEQENIVQFGHIQSELLDSWRKVIRQEQQSPDEDQTILTPDQQADRQLMRDFLNAKQCVHGGGNSWWKHELCFGKFVKQYHADEVSKNRMEIMLGLWDEAAHIQFLQANPGKKPKPPDQRKCKENKKHPQAITIFMEEPSTCTYKFTVESNLFCHLVSAADPETGIIDQSKLEV